MSGPSSMLAAGLSAARSGWPVFLLGRSKRPLANCQACPKANRPGAHDGETCGCLTCHGFYAATTDPERIAAMVSRHPDGLLALRGGAASAGAGVVVIDIDPRNGGRIDADLMAPTLAVATGNHGWHLYYRHPGGTVLSRGLPGVVGVDVKADGGYVVLPPSVHPATHLPYRWANRRGVEEMPPLLADLVTAPPAAASPVRTPAAESALHGVPRLAGTGGRIRFPDRLVEACLARVRQAPEGRRRTTLYGAARGVARVILAGHLELDTGIALLTDVGQAAEQTDRDIHAAITGGFAAEGLAL